MTRPPLALSGLCILLAASTMASAGAAEVERASLSEVPAAPRCEPDTGGTLRFGHWSRPFRFDRDEGIETASVWVRGRLVCRAGWSVTADGMAASEDVLRGRSSYGHLREAYLAWRGGEWSARLGRQMMIWGRADRLNPTDNLSRRDYTRLTSEETEQRDGVDGFTLTHRREGRTWTLLVTAPRFRGHEIPMDLPAGLPVVKDEPSSTQWALKFDQSGAEVDWSVSVLRGFDLAPSFELAQTADGRPLLRLRHPKVSVVGADAATVVGRYGVRAEAAYSWVEHGPAGDPFTRRSMFYAVAGGDRTFGDNFNVNVQLYWRHVRDPGQAPSAFDPMRAALLTSALASWDQTRQNQYGMSLRVANKWLNDTVEAEWASVWSFSQGQYAVRPRLIWHASDRLKLTLGADQYGGRDDSYFGQIRRLSSVFVLAQVGF